MRDYRVAVERALDHVLPPATVQPSRLHEAMRYAVLGDGKRIRPILTYATGEALGVPRHILNPPACAVELIHAYSLIHDDLPAMDDDDLRRGRPTCHRAFDEATAILAGDAIQALAFRVLSHGELPGISAQQRLAMVESLADASGSRGMAGGQALDLAAVGRELSLAELENMHIHKTGALIRASVRLGALCAPDAEEGLLGQLDHYAKCVGLAFQVRDDILDVEGDTAVIGKPRGSDLASNKPTYTSLLGLEGARETCDSLYREAIESLEPLGERGETLRWLARYIIRREK